MELFDTHCHLFMPPMKNHVPEVLERAAQEQVQRLLVPAYDEASWARMAPMTRYSGVWLAYGIHPWVSNLPFDQQRLAQLLAQEKTVALGEVGLDYAVRAPDREVQQRVLRQQLEIARQLDLPVILHCRDAAEDLLQILQHFSPPGLRGVIHGFSRSAELARRFLALGLHLAFGPMVTRPGSRKAQEAARAVPLDRLLLETDACAMGFSDLAAPQVEPRDLIRVAQQVALLRAMPLDDLARMTTDNAKQLFRCP
jgi:TatD DNase family protein